MTKDELRVLLAPVIQLPIWLVALGFGLVPILIAPWLKETLDARGLPGVGAAIGLILLGPILALALVLRGRDRDSRAREMQNEARARGLHFRRRFKIPRSLRELPVMAGLEVAFTSSGWGSVVGVSNLLSGRIGDSEILIFDQWSRTDSPYSRTSWRCVIALPVMVDAEPVMIEPARDALPKTVGLEQVRTESVEFARRYSVWSTDSRFTSALLDARMMRWLLELPDDWTFQVGGRWIATVGPRMPGERLDHGIQLTSQFRDRLPRDLQSLYPAPDPGFGSSVQ